MTTSLFQNVPIEAGKLGTEIAADFQIAWANISEFYSVDVKPVIGATLQYIETNGATDLLLIGKNAVKTALADLENGIPPDLGEFLASIAGTVIDEAKAADLAIAEGAAHVAAATAYAETQVTAVVTGTDTTASGSGTTTDTTGATA